MANLKGKKVTVMGLGLHGGGVASVNWLVKHGAKVTVTDLKTAKELKLSLKKLNNLSKCKLVLGRHREIDFRNADIIVQNPDVPKESKYLKIAKKAGILIENEASLFFKNCAAKIVGVTGTRGKSTTSTLIYEILNKSEIRNQRSEIRDQKSEIRNQRSEIRIWLAGQPQQPMMAILDKVKKNDLVVLELSSWQLEILGQQKLSPHVAIVTNIYPDHLNRYSSMAGYITAKKNIFKFQSKNDFVILNFDNTQTKKMGREVLSQRFWFSKKYLADQNSCFLKGDYIYFQQNGKISKLVNPEISKLKGEHNLENILAASAVAGIFGAKPKDIQNGLKNFFGLPGRIELIRTVKGIKYINDTTATTPDGTMAALKALPAKKIVLIAGGTSKNIPDFKYRELAKIISQRCRAVVLLPGGGSDQILKVLSRVNFKPVVYHTADMVQAVTLAASLAKNNDIVLLSPACASFNIFINEFDRGDKFNQVVAKL